MNPLTKRQRAERATIGVLKAALIEIGKADDGSFVEGSFDIVEDGRDFVLRTAEHEEKYSSLTLLRIDVVDMVRQYFGDARAVALQAAYRDAEHQEFFRLHRQGVD